MGELAERRTSYKLPVRLNKELTMDSISYTRARAQLAKIMSHVCESHEPVIITRSGGDSVVMLSLKDYESLEETAYLLRSPKNARRLIEAITELERTDGFLHY